MSTGIHVPPPSLLKMLEVATRTGFSQRHIWRLVAEGKFPKPVAVGRRCKRWVAADIDDFIRKLQVESSQS